MRAEQPTKTAAEDEVECLVPIKPVYPSPSPVTVIITDRPVCFMFGSAPFLNVLNVLILTLLCV